jgi:protein arginine kinase
MFTPKATREDRIAILGECKAHITSLPIADRLVWINLHDRPSIERRMLVERHLISRALARGKMANGRGGPNEPRAVVAEMPSERLAIMVNEEDHLRIQVLRAGLDLADALEEADKVDDMLEEGLDYAFSPRFGYLTACPTNVGTGARLSVMLHLPALALTGEIDKARRAAEDMSLAVRGFYGEGSQVVGDFYQVSNQTTLGRAERTVRDDLVERILPGLIDYERAARDTLGGKKRRWLEDQIFRCVAVLSGARLMSLDESMEALSKVRLGVALDMVKGIDLVGIAQLMLVIQPAHLQRAAGQELSAEDRDAARADLIRQTLRRQA